MSGRRKFGAGGKSPFVLGATSISDAAAGRLRYPTKNVRPNNFPFAGEVRSPGERPRAAQSDVSQARHIALAGTRGGNDPLRHDLLHDGQLAGVVKFFASGHSEHQQKYLCRCCYCYAAIEPGCVCAGAP